MTPLLVMFVASGFVVSAISIPLIMRKIGPNPVYGFRVKQTLEDPWLWYEANAFAGKGMLIDGMVIVIAAIVLVEVPGISVDRYALSVAAICFLALGFTLFSSFRFLFRLSRERRKPENS
jgi:uncharacterized membrane protein